MARLENLATRDGASTTAANWVQQAATDNTSVATTTKDSTCSVKNGVIEFGSCFNNDNTGTTTGGAKGDCTAGTSKDVSLGTLTQDGAGKAIDYKTSGGYDVKIENSTVTVTDPTGQHQIKEWGDPHETIDGKQYEWTDSTRQLQLGDGTVITMDAPSTKGFIQHTDIQDSGRHIAVDNTSNTVNQDSVTVSKDSGENCNNDKIEQEIDQKFQDMMNSINNRFDSIDNHLNQVDTHVGQVDTHVGQVDTHVGQVDSHVGQVDDHVSQVDTDVKNGDQALSNQISDTSRQLSQQISDGNSQLAQQISDGNRQLAQQIANGGSDNCSYPSDNGNYCNNNPSDNNNSNSQDPLQRILAELEHLLGLDNSNSSQASSQSSDSQGGLPNPLEFLNNLFNTGNKVTQDALAGNPAGIMQDLSPTNILHDIGLV